ncbi:MAG: TrmH family RNA methyltransferase [Actinomycetota bacterium]
MAEVSKADIRRLRELLHDRRAREDAGVFVAEGPRVVGAALDHSAPIESIYAEPAHPVAARAAAAGIRVLPLSAGAADRIGVTVTPQPVFAVVRFARHGLDALDTVTLALIGAPIADPGNAGTLIRSAVTAGADGVVLGSGSVDAYNPKVVRASAGACFAIRTVEGVTAVDVLERLGARGVRRIAAAMAGGEPPESFDLTAPCAFVLGSEAHGLPADLSVDAVVSIPMHAAESLNVAMAGTVLLHEAARQRRAAR